LLDTTQRKKKAKAMVAIGAVRRDDKAHVVSNGKFDYIVTRNQEREIVCDCPYYVELREQDEQCEHILAVKEFVSKGEPMPKAVREKAKEVETEAEETEFDNQVGSSESPTTAENRSNPSWFKKLQQPLPVSLVKQREGWYDKKSGEQVMVDYIEWHSVVKLLNAAVGYNWTWQVISITTGEAGTLCHGRITVDGYITRDGIGCGDSSEKGVKGAEHDALKRAATKFGIALELYDKDAEHGVEESSNMVDEPFDNPKPNKTRADSAVATAAKRQQAAGKAGNASGDNPNVATGLTNLVTAKQLGLINYLAKEAGIFNVEAECAEVCGCDPVELSKAGASTFIDHLKAAAGA
jgi:predicted nucleic acid-binding Zn finger protein